MEYGEAVGDVGAGRVLWLRWKIMRHDMRRDHDKIGFRRCGDLQFSALCETY